MELGSYGFCYGGKDAPDPPDMSAVAAASQDNAEVARENAQLAQQTAMEQLDWAKQQWAEQKEMIQQVTDVQLPLMQAQVQMAQSGMNAYIDMLDMQQQVAWENHKNAMQDRDRYERVFQPIEDDLVMEFMSYDTEGRRALEAGRAQADVARAQDAQRKQSLMQLEGYGIDPSQTRSAALDATLRTQQAASQAAAGNQARQRVEDTGRALRAEAINIGKGMPSNVAASYGTALQAGQGAQAAGQGATAGLNTTMGNLSNNAAAWQGAGNAMGGPTQWGGLGQGWMGQSNQAIGQWGNTLNQGFQNEMAAANFAAENSPMNAIAGIAGAAMGAFLAEGGEVQGPEGRDVIPAKLSHGEFVIPERVVKRKGLEFFEKLIDKAEADQDERDAEMHVQQNRERAYQGAQQMPPQQAPMQQAPMQQAPVQMADGGAATSAAKTTGTYTGRNARPMFGYSSEAALKGQQQANQATADRQALMDRLRGEIKAQKWKQVKPGWQPKKLERANFDIAGAIAKEQQKRQVQRQKDAALAAQEAAAKRAHEMKLAQINAQALANRPRSPSTTSIAQRLNRNIRTDDYGRFQGFYTHGLQKAQGNWRNFNRNAWGGVLNG